MTDEELQRHIAEDHEQGRYVYVGGDGMDAPSIEFLWDWHRTQHALPWPARVMNHSHDELGAKRWGLRLLPL